jgi:hypothetical protein
MTAKHYYLFGLRVWSVVIEAPEVVDDESDELEIEADGSNTSLDSYITPATEARPQFGFTPWTPMPWSDDWED